MIHDFNAIIRDLIFFLGCYYNCSHEMTIIATMIAFIGRLWLLL